MKTGSKHADVRTALLRQLRSGRLRPGERIPTEAELGKLFGVSRITVARAVRDLEAAGIVERRRGAGSFVRSRPPDDQLAFGLLIPELGETEIFESICQGMMASPAARHHVLLWGNTSAQSGAVEERAMNLCRQFIERRVSGVFFAPVEFGQHNDEINRDMAAALDRARIPVVLLDRGLAPYPEPDRYDLVGIDNRRAGYRITEHVIASGARRIGFLAAVTSASTVEEREAGYREALHRCGVAAEDGWTRRMSPEDAAGVREFLTVNRLDGVVCANDRTAGRLMHTLGGLGYRIPQDVRMVGIDDVSYAALLPVPLTTLRQPTHDIGEAALAVMLARVAHRGLPARDTRLHGQLVIRESCGALHR